MFWLRLSKLGKILFDPFLFPALLKGVAAGVEHRSALQGLDFESVVDVGANRGQFALICHKMFPQAKIYSFEPLEEPGQIFKEVFCNVPDVTLCPYAIGQERTTAIIHVTKDDDSSSMLPITKTQSIMFPGAAEKELRKVVVMPLSQVLKDTVIPPASLLKIDVQGFELEVLKSSEDILDRFSYLYIECSFIELYEGQALAPHIISWLEQRNFMLRSVHNLYYAENGMAVQGDFLFARRNP